MKTFIQIIAVGVLLAFCQCSGQDEKDKKDAARQVPEVTVAVPVIDSVTLHKEYPGFIQAKTKVDVVARVSGTLESVNYTAGQYVSKGQVLFTIERTQYADAVQRARAALANARSQQQFCVSRLAAMEKAFKSNAVSNMDVLQARNNLEQAQAAISTAQAELKDAQTQLGYCTVRAPGSGYITKSAVDVGNYVGGEAAPVTLATIYDTAEVTANFSIEDSQFEAMIGRAGGEKSALYRQVPLKFQQELPHTYFADLYYTAPNVEQNTGTLSMQATVKNLDAELKDGMYVSVELPYGTNPHAILVKDASISTDQRGPYLYVVGKDDKVEYRPITVGAIYRDTLRIVESGLKEGERYVTDALLTVRPGMKVSPRMVK